MENETKLWNYELKEKTGENNILKFEEGFYEITFLDDGEKTEGEFGEQVLLNIERTDMLKNEKIKGKWYISISDNIKSLYGQLQEFRNNKSLIDRSIKLKVTGSGNKKRYELVNPEKIEVETV